MVGSTSILGLTTFTDNDPIDLVAHVSTGIAQQQENLFTGVTAPNGNLEIDFNSANNRTLTLQNSGAGDFSLLVTGSITFSTLSLAGDLVMQENASQIVPGITSFAIRNNADDADNLLVTNAGVVTIRAGLTVTAGGVTVTAGGATVTAGDVTISAGSLGVGGAPNAEARVTATGTITTANPHGYRASPTLVTNANGVLTAGLYSAAAITVNAAVTQNRAAQLYAESVTATVNGTLTAHNALFLGTPVGGTTVRVIDTASGAFLTTGGVWTDNPSWAALKTDIEPVADAPALLDWLRDEFKPVRYRYPSDQPYEHRHFGYLLDDMPAHVREIVCADAEGGISGKDERGLTLALLQEAARRIKALEARVN